MTRRVVVTGMGGVTALGNDWPTIRARLLAKQTGVRRMAEWDRYEGVNTRLAAPVENFVLPEHWPRKKTRTMGRVAQLSVFASERALDQAGLIGDSCLMSGRTGVAYGSSFGSPDSVLGFYELKMHGASKSLNATTYIQMMGHTTAVNIGLFFGLTGRVIPTSSACTSGSQAIGYAFETILAGKADIMVAGGAEELDITDVAVFDTMFATSTRNDGPEGAPQPYDKNRDGLVIGEGAATLVLEEREHALARGATILAEIAGFGCNSDGRHITQPQAATMEVAMRLALEDAGLAPDAIGVVNGHGTATEWGDIAETQATAAVMGNAMPIHSLKSYFGHSLGACGSLEAWLAIEMMKEGWFAPTVNLIELDDRCAELDYIRDEPRKIETEFVMSNNFAFGGINTSLILKRP
jgi:3-oxoacyl-[acyl-carrier-protein] synthase II